MLQEEEEAEDDARTEADERRTNVNDGPMMERATEERTNDGDGRTTE